MCGIVGYVGSRPVVNFLVSGLRRLEYRGYDSAGIAVWHEGKFETRRSEGKLANVEKLLEDGAISFASAHVGIGHTRWATHGKPTTQNAHPHRVGPVVLVHNGIIENYQEIKKDVLASGQAPQSETDSELFGFLVLKELKKIQNNSNKVLKDNFLEAVRLAFLQLHGACSIVIVHDELPHTVVGIRNGSPLVVANDPKGGAFFASDAQPLVEYTKEVIFLENGDFAIGTPEGLEIRSLETFKNVERMTTTIDWNADKMDKQGYAHYMLKEIFEQPVALVDTLNGVLDRVNASDFPLSPQPGVELLKNAEEIIIIACGTSWHAGLVGKYWLERMARIPVQVELASEFRYRQPIVKKGCVILGITQSGETADTLAVIREMKQMGVPTVAITNVRNSTISRDADAVFYTSAGPEIGVAATKTFLSQLMVQFLLAGAFVKSNLQGLTKSQLFEEVIRLPHTLKEFLENSSGMLNSVKTVSRSVLQAKGFFFIGRGLAFPIALEGALKLKEIAYVHAEGYAAGELKHGPIAMIDEQMVVVVLAPQDTWRDKTVSNLEEVKARGAKILGVGSEKDQSLKSLCDFWIGIPEGTSENLLPFFIAPVIQLLSYEIALAKGTDIDKPRNLAKSVTVE